MEKFQYWSTPDRNLTDSDLNEGKLKFITISPQN